MIQLSKSEAAVKEGYGEAKPWADAFLKILCEKVSPILVPYLWRDLGLDAPRTWTITCDDPRKGSREILIALVRVLDVDPADLFEKCRFGFERIYLDDMERIVREYEGARALRLVIEDEAA